MILIGPPSPPPPILQSPPRKAMVAEQKECMNWKNNKGFKFTINIPLDKRLAAGQGIRLQDV